MVPKQNGVKLSRWQSPHASSVPCLLSSVHPTETFDKKIRKSRSSGSLMTYDDTLPEEQLYIELSFLDDLID